MSPHHPDSEDAIEKATIQRFKAMGFATANLYHETFREDELPLSPIPSGKDGYWGRANPSEVVFRPRLRQALHKLNPDLPPEAIVTAIDAFTRDRSAMNPVLANQEIHNLLKSGVPVTWKGKDGEDCSDRVRIVDWDKPANNDLLLVQQMWVTGEIYKKRCDLIACVNGIPLVFIELKKPGVNVKHAFDDNLWAACDCVLGRGENLETPTAKIYPKRVYEAIEGVREAKLDWLRRAYKFAKNYFGGDALKMTRCLKRIDACKLWEDLNRTNMPVDYTLLVERQDNTTVTQTVACAGGKCELI